MKNRLILMITIFLSSCSGYQFSDGSNPFAQYHIKSVAVPMFVNDSIFPGINTYLTKEISIVLSKFKDLKIYNGESAKADAYLIGIIKSEDKRKNVFDVRGRRFTDDTLEESIGQRQKFYIPQVVSYKTHIRFVLIKRPSKKELELIRGKLSNIKVVYPKIVLDETVEHTEVISNIINDSLTRDSGGVVNSTQNRGVLEKSYVELSKIVAGNFKEVVLDAF